MIELYDILLLEIELFKVFFFRGVRTCLAHPQNPIKVWFICGGIVNPIGYINGAKGRGWFGLPLSSCFVPLFFSHGTFHQGTSHLRLDSIVSLVNMVMGSWCLHATWFRWPQLWPHKNHIGLFHIVVSFQNLLLVCLCFCYVLDLELLFMPWIFKTLLRLGFFKRRLTKGEMC